MCKVIDWGMIMINIGLLEKNGGCSGYFICFLIKLKESDEWIVWKMYLIVKLIMFVCF